MSKRRTTARRRPPTILRRASDLPPLASNVQTAAPAATFAEQISASANGAIDAHSTILARLRGVAARLGAPDSNGKEEARPCRSGRLGDIADKVDTLSAQASVAADLLDYIERQV